MSNLGSYFTDLESQYGLPSGYLGGTARIESGMNPNARNRSSSAGGLFQFIDSTAQQYGLADRFDPYAASDAAARLAADNAERLRPVLGRDPTPGELYLAHQQGGGGAASLLANPDARAVDIVGSDAVRLNGGSDDMTAGQFASRWTAKLDGGDGGDATLMGSAGDDTLGTSAPSDYAPPNNYGGLGGLGGFLQSDEFGDMLSDIGMSIATSPSNNWLANLPEIQATNNARRDKKRERAESRDAVTGALRAVGLTAEEAAQYANNPEAAEMVVKYRAEKEAQRHQQQFGQTLRGAGGGSGYGDRLSGLPKLASTEPADAAGGMSSAPRSAMFAPNPLGTTMPDRSGGSDVVPVTASTSSSPVDSQETNQTHAWGQGLYAEADRIRQAGMMAETDDQRAMAKMALDDVNSRIDHYETWAEKRAAESAPTDDIREFEYAKRQGFEGSFRDWQMSGKGGANGGEPTYSTAPVYARDENGNIVVTQLGDNATAKTTQMPDGLTPMGPYDTSFDRSRGTTAGKNLADTQFALPGAQTTAAMVADQVDSLKKDPYLGSMVGPVDSTLPNWSAGANRVQSKMDQLQGGAFLQARQLLKGGGAITDFEGKKAEAAFIRMNAAQGESDYMAALDEFNDAVQTGVAKLEQQARGGTPAASPAPAAGAAGVSGGLSWSVR